MILLLEHLKRYQVTKLVIAGMVTHLCIMQPPELPRISVFNVWAHDACATKASCVLCRARCPFVRIRSVVAVCATFRHETIVTSCNHH